MHGARGAGNGRKGNMASSVHRFNDDVVAVLACTAVYLTRNHPDHMQATSS